MSYFVRVNMSNLLFGYIYNRRVDTCSGGIAGFVDWNGIKAEIYYDIDAHNSYKETSFNINYAYLSIKFDNKTIAKSYTTPLDIPTDKFEYIIEKCKEYISSNPSTEFSRIKDMFNMLTDPKNVEIARLKSILDQHKIAY